MDETKPSIICVDDEITILHSLREELESMFGYDYNIEITESADEAIQLLEELLEADAEIPVVIADYIMPERTGDELLKLINQINPQTVGILLTGQASLKGTINAVNEAGVYRFISKPWNKDDLCEKIKQSLSRYEEKQIEIKNKKLREINNELSKIAQKRSEQLAVNMFQPGIENFEDPVQRLSEEISNVINKSLHLIKSGIDTAYEIQNNISSHDSQIAVDHLKGIYHFYETTTDIIDNLIYTFDPDMIKTWFQHVKNYELQGELNNISSVYGHITESAAELSARKSGIRPQIGNKSEKIIAWNNEEILIFAIEDVLFFTAEDKNTMVVTKKGKYKVREILDVLEHRLNTQNFFRCHRGFLINIDHISKIIPWVDGYISKFDGFPYEIPISKSRTKKMKEILGI